MVHGVTVLGDFLRPDGKGLPGGVDRPVGWMFDATKRQLTLASGLPVDLLTASASPELRTWVESLRPPAQADPFWASWYHRIPASDGLERAVLQRLRGKFCVGYELPPGVATLLAENAIPFVDIRLHPVRFMDDLMFAVRASDAATQAALSDISVAESEIAMTAGLREAMCRLITEAAVPEGTLLVLGQRPFDSSQIFDGKFFDAMAHVPEIAAICARYPAIVLKPHPQERAHSLLVAVAGCARNVLGVIDDNVYRMLAMPEIAAVLTVSSSVAFEAPYFGKAVHTLAKLPMRLGWRGESLSADMHASIDDRVLSPDFWRLVLAPHAAVTPMDGVRFAPKPNRLRIALDSFWNFQEIDTDRVPRRAG